MPGNAVEPNARRARWIRFSASSMHRSDHLKPDGRRLWLYGQAPIEVAGPMPTPGPAPGGGGSHCRWHPLLGEWVVYASHRQDRTFLPTAESNPLAPTADPSRPTELPAGRYDVAVFQNRFPTLVLEPPPPPVIPGVTAAEAFGECEVVVFSQDPAASLGTLADRQVALILEVLADRTRELAGAGIRYVLAFENRGVEMGVTLSHPHGQIYGYGFVPAIQRLMLANMRRHRGESGGSLVTDLAAAEITEGSRLVARRERAAAFVPGFARYPFETWIVPLGAAPSHLSGLDAAGRLDLASATAEAVRRLDRLFGVPMPYLLTVNQAPTDGASYPEWTLFVAIWPIRRAPGKLKYLAGTELGAGVFAGDILPETAAAALRQAGEPG